ncbi:MAG: type II toxin-antitoxin system HipA family toxin [Candidatus Limnocylindrales bacterium]
MKSGPAPDEVEVLLQRPGESDPSIVGSLRRVGAGSRTAISFAFDQTWLDDRRSFAIDPSLGLYPGDQFAPDGGLFGILSDAAPDRWGRSLMERREAAEATDEGRKVRRLDEWDFLLGVADPVRMGGLRLRNPRTVAYLADRPLPIPPFTRLRELEAAARALESPRQDPVSEARWLKILLAPGSSLGGARPKATFLDESGAPWIAKFPSRSDTVDVGAWEYVLHGLAATSGIKVPEARLLDLGASHRTFAARRFDRVGDQRHHYASAMTLTGHVDGEPASYLDVAEAIGDHADASAIPAELAQTYRRLVFNVLAGVRDDHLRNHGFLWGAGGWRLSPAFDLTPTPGRDRHALSLDGDSDAPDLAMVIALAPYFRLSKPDANTLVNEVRRAVAEWRGAARSVGLGTYDVQQMEPAFSEG